MDKSIDYKIIVNHKYTSRVANALCESIKDNSCGQWSYMNYVECPVTRNGKRPYGHQIGNIWNRTLKGCVTEFINLIYIIYNKDDIDFDLLKKAKYSDGAEIFTIEFNNNPE